MLPTPLWHQFAEHYRRACGVRLVALDRTGLTLGGGEGLEDDCDNGDASRCRPFYRKIADQVCQGEDVLLFRCPGERMIFAAPVHVRQDGAPERLVLAGGEIRARGEPAALHPQQLLGFAHLAQTALTAVTEGYFLRKVGADREVRIRSLFELSGELRRAGSLHELNALALNTLAVVFDVSSAALLVPQPGGEGFRVHTAVGMLERPLRAWAASGTFSVSPSSPPDRSQRPVRIEDPVALRRMGLPESTERLVAFPIPTDSDVAGILAVFNTELAAEDEQLIAGFASQLSLILENRRLRSEVLERAQDVETMRQVAVNFQACLELDALFSAILGEACRITGAQKGSLMVAAQGARQLFVRAARGIHERIVEKLRIRSGEGVAGNVFATGEPVLVGNVELDTRFLRKNRSRYQTKSFVSFPIALGSQVLGVVNLSDKLSGENFVGEDLARLQAIATQAVLAIERSSYFLKNRELRKISITDPLTGLLNRRYFQERLAEEVDRAKRHDHPLSLIMIDIDHFKAYNDANGHPAGDKALVLVGRSLRGSIRAIDVVSRFGGEEFAVILPETRAEEALEIAERIRKEVESFYFPGEESLPGGRLTVSLGVAGFAEAAGDLKALILRAVQALYQAKGEGRNRVVGFGISDRLGDRTWTKVL
ncbi:MAG: sensor domain-containing diguanylate cyclase [Deltaproteobacteria bacterium]|nr:sensor domain-containing diguanylate cyclase [Deltaproteobacteria bacterium]